ncbi:MAG: FtsX-like permease family protein [Bacteroidota bacterium]
MLKNYLKSSLRNLLKNPLSSFINVFGLAIAIATSMIGYTYLAMELGMEKVHTKADRTYMVTSLVDRDGEAALYGPSPAPFGQQIRGDFPQVKRTTRINYRNVVISREPNVFHETVMLVDSTFMHMFDFDIVQGSQTALDDRYAVIISEDAATKYFGEDRAIGQTLGMRFSNGQKISLTVGAVVSIQPMTTSLGFDFLASFELLPVVNPDFKPSDWSTNITATFVELDDPSSMEVVVAGADGYRPLVNGAQRDWQIHEFTFEPLATLYDRSNEIRWDLSSESDKEGQIIINAIGVLMLLLACLNYLNIAIASATKRLKEIGVRKVIGANRQRLIVQFILENVLLSALALVMGLLIANFFFIPGLNNLFAIEFRIDILSAGFVAYLVGLLLFTAVASGAYPAVYISRFQAVSIFRGSLRFGKKNRLTKVFLTLQFILACVTVVCGIAFTQNTHWINNQSWGYDQQNTIVVPVADQSSYQQLRNALQGISDIEMISGGAHHLGLYAPSSIVQFPDRKLEASRLDIEDNYVSTMGLNMKSGRDFKKDYSADETNVIVNETFVANMEWDEALGKTFRYDSTQYTVIGVLEDFHFYSFWAQISPVFLRLGEEENHRYLCARVARENTAAAYAEIESVWTQLFPDVPFDGEFQADVFADFFRNVNGHRVMMTSVAIMGLLLSCFGLYGLVALNVAGRRKEFSIRKVLGAGLGALVRAVSSHFTIFMIIAMAVGAPVSYFLIKMLIETIYEYHMPMTVYPVLMAIGLIMITVLLTLSSQIRKVSTANPTEGLRSE